MRDRYGRPFVSQDGLPLQYEKNRKTYSNAVGYTRVSTLAGTLDDSSGLIDWAAAQAAIGTVRSPGIAASIAALASAHGDPWNVPEAKRALKPLVERARQAAGSDEAADLGTGFHGITELIDMGREPEFIPPQFAPWIEKYREALADWEVLDCEPFVVNDELQTAGSLDRLLRHKRSGQVVVGDLKGLPLDTKIPTPVGWSTMADLRVGDEVFGSDGKTCQVTAKSEIKRIGTYVVKFDDKSEVVCDSEHLWWTFNHHDVEGVRGMQELIDTLHTRRGQAQHKVPVAAPLDLEDADLPVPPYLLGVWIGDGAERGGVITKQEDLFDVLREDGVELGVAQRQPTGKEHIATYSVLGLTKWLRSLGVLRNKHLPISYLRGSYWQRLLLLQGLMDTDGTWNKARDTAVFNTVSERLARDVEELLLSLGQRPHVAKVRTRGFGKEVDSFAVQFTPVRIEPFRLPRKLQAMRNGMIGKKTTVSERRLIKSIERGPDVETVCIAVDSPNRTYLCTERFIPTHNTGKSDPQYPLKVTVQVAIYANSVCYDQATGVRTPLHEEIDLTQGVLIHAPIRSARPRCTLYPLDLELGWELAGLSKRVREARRLPKLEAA